MNLGPLGNRKVQVRLHGYELTTGLLQPLVDDAQRLPAAAIDLDKGDHQDELAGHEAGRAEVLEEIVVRAGVSWLGQR